MLPKQNKLKRMKDFDILFKEGRFVNGELLSVRVWRVNPSKYPRRKYEADDLKIGFLVGKKVHKGAVKRNRIKRQMREVIGSLLKKGSMKKGYHLALVAKPVIFGKEYKDTEKDILSLLKRAGVL